MLECYRWILINFLVVEYPMTYLALVGSSLNKPKIWRYINPFYRSPSPKLRSCELFFLVQPYMLTNKADKIKKKNIYHLSKLCLQNIKYRICLKVFPNISFYLKEGTYFRYLLQICSCNRYTAVLLGEAGDMSKMKYRH